MRKGYRREAKTFRVLTVTTDHHRMQSMMEALRKLRVPHSPGAPSSFSPRATSCAPPIRLRMNGVTGNGRAVRLN